MPRCDILTWAYQERNLEKGIDFCKSSDSKGAENKPLKSLKNSIAETQNTEKKVIILQAIEKMSKWL